MIIMYPILIFVVSYFSYHFCTAAESVKADNHGVATELPAHKFCIDEPEIIPANKTHTASMIFLHDLDECGPEWTDIFEDMHLPLPYMRIVCPSSDYIPIKWYYGLNYTAWFDFNKRHYPMDECDLDGITKAAAYVHYLINEEIKLGIKPERIIVGGIGQGGLLALQAALSFPKRLGGIIALTPWNPESITLKKHLNHVNKNIPIFQGHVTLDLYMNDDAAKKISKALTSSVSNNVHFKIYKGVHESTKEELEETMKFCEKYVAPV